MFYEVKVKDASGNVRKVISPKALSARFWKDHMGDSQGYSSVKAVAADLDFEPKGNEEDDDKK